METRAFDLNIGEVLEHWSVVEAVRELIANALDEHRLTGTDPPVIVEEADGWHIRDFGRGLRYVHLTQDEDDEKMANADLVIGKFGVGLKDALATCHRHDVEVRIRSRQNDLTFGLLAKAGFADVETLHAIVAAPSDPDMVGTDVVLSGPTLTAADVEAAKALFLVYGDATPVGTTRYGTVLPADDGEARIYVNGLQVAVDPDLLFSYDITSPTAKLRKALNRERTNVGRQAYSDRVVSILLDCTDARVIDALVADLQGYEAGTWHYEVQRVDVGLHACQQLNAQRDVIFLTPADLAGNADFVDRARGDRYTPVVVPSSIAAKLAGAVDATGAPIRDLATYREEWNDSFAFTFVDPADLTPEEKAVWALLDDVFAMRGGRPRRVRQVRISDTMRLMAGAYREACGVWDRASGTIIIKRDELATPERFVGTVLHEIAHAVSGAGDISLAFEEALTGEAGRAATHQR